MGNIFFSSFEDDKPKVGGGEEDNETSEDPVKEINPDQLNHSSKTLENSVRVKYCEIYAKNIAFQVLTEYLQQ